jgi:serine/threonine protein phosphatase PrpC
MSAPIWNITAAGVCHTGGKSTNEDAFFVKSGPGGASAHMGVFDGHGADVGRRAAEIARDVVGASDGSRPGALFAEAERQLKQHILTTKPGAQEWPDGSLSLRTWTGAPAPAQGGTTATEVTVADGKVRVAHVGDSEVMVINLETGDWVRLNNDHSSTAVTEFQRALAACPNPPTVTFDTAGGQFGRGHGPRPTFVLGADGNYQLNPTGGYYYSNVSGDWAAYVRRDGVALNMFRALGDFHLKAVGLSAEPDVLEHTLTPHKTLVVAASDGLYDNFTAEQLRDFVMSLWRSGSMTAEQLRDAILVEGLKRGFKNFGRTGQDNTTVCVALAQPHSTAQIRLPLGFGTLCRTVPAADALRMAVMLRGAGIGLTLAGGVLTCKDPLDWLEARVLAAAV